MDANDTYHPRRPSRSSLVEVRGLACHVRRWGPEETPPLVMLHGSRDTSATWQFVIDHFRRDRAILAPDWRGHGRSGRNPQGYWFQDYLADLDALLDRVCPDEPVTLIGHSLGGNVACTYAGVRPRRVARLVALDGFGMSDEDAATTPDHLRAWLDAWRDPPGVGKSYASIADMADRLVKANPRLDVAKALFLARHMATETKSGFVWSFDALHRLPFGIRHRRAEWAACMQRIEAPTLWIASGRPARFQSEPGGLAARAALIRDMTFRQVPDTSHNLHHDDPARVAQLIEDFLDSRHAAHPTPSETAS